MRKTAEASEVVVPAGHLELEGNLLIPAESRGVVLFAHGSGSSRHSPRNRFVADFLNSHGLGTLLIDLLSAEEESADSMTGHLRFNIAFLAERLLHAINWLKENSETRDMKIGLFGSSTGAGAALVAAAEWPEAVNAVVSRGGRPDLAAAALEDVECPTLLIVGGYDEPVIELNREALADLRCVKQMKIVPRATHLFEEAGALEEVARLASDWFGRHLAD